VRPLFFWTLTVLLTGAAGISPAGAATKYQFEANGIGSLLSGGSEFLGGHSVHDLFGKGYGFSLGVNAGFTDHLGAGIRTGLFRDTKDFSPSLAPARWASSANYSAFAAARATSVNRKLTTIPTLAVLQYRARIARGFGFFDEFGVGAASFTEKVAYERNGATSFVLANRQKNLVLQFGGGATYDLGPAASLALSASVLMVPSKDGAIWSGGDNPQFVQLALGIRYPRR
jgi:hypothetical protein